MGVNPPVTINWCRRVARWRFAHARPVRGPTAVANSRPSNAAAGRLNGPSREWIRIRAHVRATGRRPPRRADADLGAHGQRLPAVPMLCVHTACHNPNTGSSATPLVDGPLIRLPGAHAKVRRDGYSTA